jgi:hypothetical protein
MNKASLPDACPWIVTRLSVGCLQSGLNRSWLLTLPHRALHSSELRRTRANSSDNIDGFSTGALLVTCTTPFSCLQPSRHVLRDSDHAGSDFDLAGARTVVTDDSLRTPTVCLSHVSYIHISTPLWFLNSISSSRPAAPGCSH